MSKIIYDTFEMDMCIAYDQETGQPYHALKDPDRLGYVEPIGWNAITEELEPYVFYSVYGHLPEGGRDCVADFFDEDSAAFCRAQLEAAIVPELGNEYEEWCDEQEKEEG